MSKCRECGTQQVLGTLYCSECGAFLLQTSDESEHVSLPFIEEADAVDKPPLLGQEMTPSVTAEYITFVIPNSGRRVRKRLSANIRVGRMSSDEEQSTDLNLAPDGGANHGVSRFHATISVSHRGVVLVDTGSTNGTRLNGYRLPSDLPYPLHSGDEIRFGNLLVHVFLE